MPRKPRFFVPDIPCHVIQRGNNREPVFIAEEDYRTYLGWLQEGMEQHGCALHAYVLMTNHVHLLMTPQSKQGIGLSMQYVGRRYVPYINDQYRRSGTLWEGRYKASVINSKEYLLTCMRYIELNPVRAAMVKSPGEYKWSSYLGNAYANIDLILTPHEEYLALGLSEKERTTAYRELFRSCIDEEDLHEIRTCCQTGTPLGNNRFREKIERMLQAKVGQSRRGRPSKSSAGCEKGY